jgi:hypothetical protein
MINTANIDEVEVGAYLSSYNWPGGLQKLLVENHKFFPTRFGFDKYLLSLANTNIHTMYRYVIVDDSGSMGIKDGHCMVEKKNGMKSETCSRWTELTGALRFHANLAQKARSPTEFWFLNRPEPIVVGADDGAGLRQLEAIFQLVENISCLHRTTNICINEERRWRHPSLQVHWKCH